MKNKKYNLAIISNDQFNGGSFILSKTLNDSLKNSTLTILSDKNDNIFKTLKVFKIFKRRVLINIKDLNKLSKDFDIFHINFITPLLFPLLLKRNKKVITFHFMLGGKKSNLFEGGFIKSRFYKIIDDLRLIIDCNLYIMFGDKFIFLTTAQKNSFKKFILFKNKLENNYKIIPDFIKKEDILNRVTRTNSSLSILFVGRLDKLKGFEDLIKIMNDNQIRNKKINFGIIGDGFLKGKIPLSKKISYFKSVENSQLTEYYKKYQILILPSYSETFGMVILEAMAKGLVILTSDLPPIKEYFINDRNGYTFPPGDIEKMKELILYLKNNPKEIERISKNNLKDIWKFTAEKQAPKYIKVYEEVLNEKGK
jgi:glycosyltransferase involved in cell wall biosynthesis